MIFKQIRRLAYLGFVIVLAFFEAGRSGLVRRTFEFTTFDTGKPVVEARMIRKAPAGEQNIKNYVEELILGPVSVDFAPLVNKGVTLRSLLYRDSTVYADFSADAVLPVLGGQPLFDSFLVLNRNIRRNFSNISEVRLFCNGNELFFAEFTKIFDQDDKLIK